MVGLVLHGVRRRVERVQSPRQERAAGAGDAEIQVIDEGRVDIGRAGHVVPRQGHLQFGHPGDDLHLEELRLALGDRVLGEAAGAHEVDGRLDPHRPVAELVVRAGVAPVLGGPGKQRLDGRVARVRLAGELDPEVFQEQRRQPDDGRTRHRGTAKSSVGGVAGTAGRGHAVVAADLATRRAEVRLDPAVVNGAPTGEAGHRVVVGIQRANGDVVLGARRRRRAVEVTEPLDVAVAALPFVAVGPDDAKRLGEHPVGAVAPDDGVDEDRGDAVITLDLAREAVGLGVGADGVVGDVGPKRVDRLGVVVLDVAGVRVQEDSAAIELEPVGEQVHPRCHPAELAAAGGAVATDGARRVRGVIGQAGTVVDGQPAPEIVVARQGRSTVVDQRGHAGAVEIERRRLDDVRLGDDTVGVVEIDERGQRRLDPLHGVIIGEFGNARDG